MRALVEERSLCVLRLTTTNRPQPDSMACVLRRGDERLIDVWTTPQTDLGLTVPGTERRSSRRDPARDARLEPHIETFFRELRDRLPPDEPLWLELVSPKGGLIFLPWERWLTPIFERPILRLPRFALQPVRQAGRLQIAYCSSAPLAKAAVPVSQLAVEAAAALAKAGVPATLHIFVDSGLADQVARDFDRRGLADAAVIYPADETPSDATRTTGGSSPLTSPWLRWMSTALAGRGVDLVHFANHGYLARGRGSLAFANTPARNDDPAWARFVGAAELTRFLDLVGAGGLLLTSPPQDFSVSGLLALADEVVASRPGPVLFHDAADDPDANDLGAGLSFLFGEGQPPRAATVSLWAHPDHLQTQENRAVGLEWSGSVHPEPDDPVEPTIAEIDWRTLYRPSIDSTESTGGEMGSVQILDHYTLAGKVGRTRLPGLRSSRGRGGNDEPEGAMIEPEPPLWLQSSQRILERHAAKLAATKLGLTDSKQASQKGAAEALRYVAGILGDDGEDLL